MLFRDTIIMCEEKGECKIFIYFIQGSEKGCTIVYEDSKKGSIESVAVDCTALQLIKEICRHHELDFNGCRKIIAGNHGFKQKVPIFIEENNILFYPLNSLRDRDSLWINYYAVKHIAGKDNQSIITFGRYRSFSERMILRALNESEYQKHVAYTFDFDVRMIRHQYHRCKKIDDYVKQKRYDLSVSY